LTVFFFDHEGDVHHEYATPGQTITKDHYIKVLGRLKDAVRRKQQQLWASDDWHLHHDKSPAHSSSLVQNFWQNITSPRSVSPPTAQICLPATSGFSQN
jgi:hypothetical protein